MLSSVSGSDTDESPLRKQDQLIPVVGGLDTLSTHHLLVPLTTGDDSFAPTDLPSGSPPSNRRYFTLHEAEACHTAIPEETSIAARLDSARLTAAMCDRVSSVGLLVIYAEATPKGLAVAG